MTKDLSSNKVARLIEAYDLEGFGDELERSWTDEGEERKSLRDLATVFNERLLEERMRTAGMSTLGQDVETTYRNLTGDDVSAGVRADTRTTLERNGIDVDSLEREFVTYQAVRSYLTEWRGAEYRGPSDEEKVRNDLESIQRLLSRARTVTEERIETLESTGRLDVEEFEVILDATVLCQDCGSQYAVAELFEEGGCECHQD